MKITKTSITKPPKICIYGQHGIGKSSFAAGCMSPIFIQTEDGLGSLGVDAFDLALSYEDVMKALDHLMINDLPYKTIVIDSLDWLEKLIFRKVCTDKGVTDIGAIPFGRGYGAALLLWEEITDMLTILNNSKKMMIVLLAHAQIKKFEDPSSDNYDRYNLDLQTKSAAHISEFVDILGYAGFKTVVISKDGGFGQTITKGKGTGERVLNLEERPAFTAKNRYGLPAQLPFTWGALAHELKAKLNKDKDDTLNKSVNRTGTETATRSTQSNIGATKNSSNLLQAQKAHQEAKENHAKEKEEQSLTKMGEL